jgi:hypothetical protein
VNIEYWWECQKERNHYEDQDISGWIMFKWILDGMDWIDLAEVTDKWRVIVNTVMDLRFL